MSNVLKNNTFPGDNPVDKMGTTTEKQPRQGSKNNIMQIIISGIVAVAIALMHEYVSQIGLCEPVTAAPETAGPLGAAIRGLMIAGKNT